VSSKISSGEYQDTVFECVDSATAPRTDRRLLPVLDGIHYANPARSKPPRIPVLARVGTDRKIRTGAPLFCLGPGCPRRRSPVYA